MMIDLSSANSLVSYINGEAEFADVWTSDGFQLIQEFSQRFDMGPSRQETKEALDEHINDLPALSTFEHNLTEVTELLDKIEQNKHSWESIIEDEVSKVIPDEKTAEIPIYPVPNDFYGFGLPDGICININDPILFEYPREFVYLSIHEATHTLYQKVHGSLNLRDVQTPADKRSFFNILTHTEGYAVYTPLEIRANEDALIREGLRELESPSTPFVRDAEAMLDDNYMAGVVKKYDSLQDELARAPGWDQYEFLERVMAEDRCPYRIGGRLIKEIEDQLGIAEVHKAFYMDADAFVETCDHLLDDLR